MIKLKMIFLVGFLLLAVVSIFNQTKVCNAVDNLIEFPGQTESVGTYFEIKDSEYLNLILESSEEVRVILESIPKMISLNIDNINDDIGFTNLVLVGLEPNKTYYKYEDSYKNLVVFVADGDGIYSWTQEINQPHHVWIQEIKSTIFLPEDCSVYGDWNEALSTCTLNRNLYETVEITRDDIILDCDDYSIIGPDSAYGLYLWDRSGVVIISCNINNFSIGINLYRSNNNKFIDNNVSENWNGFNIYNSDSNVLINNIISSNRNSGVRNSSSFNNTFTGNIISNNLDTGILNHSSFNNTFTENIISNSYLGIYHYLSSHSTFTGNIMFDSRSNFDIFGTDVSHYTNYADTSNLVDGKPIYYLLSAEDQIFDSSTNAGLFLCIGCNNITIKDLTFSKNRCSIFFWDTHNSKIENIITLNTYCGINFEHSTNNIITNNTFSGVVNDKSFGVRLSRYSNNNIIVDNTFSNHYYGISIDDSVDNKVYHNNFIDNSRSSVSCGEAGNFFDNDHLDGGNYWDDYDESLEGCKDADNNGICDDPYVFEYGIGQDNYPFMNENGWEEQKTVPLYTQVISDYPSREETRLWFDKDYAQGSDYGCGSTIAECGCAITSMVMIGRFYDIDIGINDSDVDPKNINDWLNINHGYSGPNLYWSKAVEYLGYIDNGEKMARLSFDYYNEPSSSPQIDAYVDSGKPIVARSDIFGHYFVIDGKLNDIYTVKDPYWYNTKTLDDSIADHVQDYNNYFTKANLFSYLETPRKIAASMHIYLASPAELVIIDPDGKKLGRDPISGESYNNIPGSSYTTEGAIISSDNPLYEIHEKKVIYIPNPIDGLYNIQVIGTGDGNYTLTSFIYDNEGESKEIIQKGSIVQNDVQEFELNYSTEDVQRVETYQIIDINIKPGSEPNSINLKSKGVTPVAVLSNQFFDAQEINIESILFSGANPVKWNIKDVDDDGDLDLILHFETQDLNLTSLDIEAILTGELNNGTLIKGSNPIRIVGKNNKK